MEVNLKHKASFNGKSRLYGISSIVLLVVAVSACVIAVFSKNAALSSIMFIVLLFSVCILVTVAILYVMLTKRIKETGSFEEIDIIENKIFYRCEEEGTRIIAPEDIGSMKIYKINARSSDDMYYDIKIRLKNTDEIFAVTRWVSEYGELVRKMRIFKKNNNIPG